MRVTDEGGIEREIELIQEVGLMDDRNLSRNASSTRAIPTKKFIEEVRSDVLRAAPVFWGRNRPGMQATEEWEGVDLIAAQNRWRFAALSAANHAETMMEAGDHKQTVNRILQPFSHYNVLVSATEWDNFFGLRIHPAAQPEICVLATEMWNALKNSVPSELEPGEWHLPFIDDIYGPISSDHNAIKISVARCARVSYESFETGRRSTVEEDLRLYEKLVGAQPLHASPAEHQATPDRKCPEMPDGVSLPSDYGYSNNLRPGDWEVPAQHGNFVGWRQYRKMLPGEACALLRHGEGIVQ